MAKTVTVNIADEAGNLVATEVVMSDAIENLVAQGVLVGDDEGIFFQRQLEHIQAKSYDVLYPDLAARQVFPLNTEGGEGINTITYRSYDKRGETAIIAGKATDLPRADISGKEYSILVKSLGNAFGYSRQELAAARLTGLPLEQQKASAARRSYEEKVNQLTWFGNAENKINGLFGGPVDGPWATVSVTQVADSAAGGNRTWRGNKTPDEVIADLTAACTQMYAQTLKLFSPNKILISVADKKFLQNTARSINSDTSIMNWFLANNDFIKSADDFIDVNELANIYGTTTAGFKADGTGMSGFTILSLSEDNMRMREPFPLTHLPVQYKGLEFEINCYGRFAGLELIRPAAVQHFYGI